MHAWKIMNLDTAEVGIIMQTISLLLLRFDLDIEAVIE